MCVLPEVASPDRKVSLGFAFLLVNRSIRVEVLALPRAIGGWMCLRLFGCLLAVACTEKRHSIYIIHLTPSYSRLSASVPGPGELTYYR